MGATRRAARSDTERLSADAAARSQHGRLHALSRIEWRTRLSTKRRRAASTSFVSSTRSTASSRCVPRSKRCSRLTSSPKARCAIRATWRIPASSSTRSTTTCESLKQLVATGCHILCVKDMAGLLRAPAATTLDHRAARAIRPAGASSHPRHVRRSAGDVPRRHRSRRRCRRRRGRAALGHDESAAVVGDCGGD